MSAKVNVQVTAKRSDVEAVSSDAALNVSQKIRALYAMGIAKAEIALILDKRYQHVRNVLLTPIKEAKQVVEMTAEHLEG
jgi:uncharacterized protein YggE